MLFNEYEGNDLKENLIALESNILKNKTQNRETNKYSNFYFYIYSGTSSRQARVIRSTIIREEIFNLKNRE